MEVKSHAFVNGIQSFKLFLEPIDNKQKGRKQFQMWARSLCCVSLLFFSAVIFKWNIEL